MAARPIPTSPRASSAPRTRYLEDGLRGVKRIPYDRARKAACVHRHDYIGPYVADLANVVDMEAIRASGVKIGIDPLGGAAVHYWQPIIERYGIAATIVSDAVDPTFRFMTADWDGKIRMDCSSPYAMARLIGMRDRFDVAFANDTDADRHGIVTRSNGLMNPNHYLAAAIAYLFEHRPAWGRTCRGGQDHRQQRDHRPRGGKARPPAGRNPGRVQMVRRRPDRRIVRFRRRGKRRRLVPAARRSVWTTDKDGIILGLLAAEITARTGQDPGQRFDRLTDELGVPFYERIDAPATVSAKESAEGAFAGATGDQGTCRRAGPRDADAPRPATANLSAASR